MFRALCAHHQEVKIVLYSIWHHHTCRWPSGAQVERGLTCVRDGHLQVWWYQMLYNTILTSWWWAHYLHTYSMVQSPFWEANWFAASQEIPRILWNLRVHYRTHKRPPPVPILGQPNPVHIPTSHLLEIHPNIIHPSTRRSPQWSLSVWFPHQDPIHPLSSPIRATCPTHLILETNTRKYHFHVL